MMQKVIWRFVKLVIHSNLIVLINNTLVFLIAQTVVLLFKMRGSKALKRVESAIRIKVTLIYTLYFFTFL